MPARRRAAVYVQPDKPHPSKQERVALAFADESGLEIVSICGAPEDCLGLLRSGAVDVIIAALSTDLAFIEDVEALAGGSAIVTVREPPARSRRREVAPLAVRMAHRGMGVREIAAILDVDTQEIRQALTRITRAPQMRTAHRPGRRSGRGGSY